MRNACLIFCFLFFVYYPLKGGEVKLLKTDGIVKYSDGRRSYRNMFIYPNGVFLYSLFWRNPDTQPIVQIGFKEGTFGHFHWVRPSYFWSPDGKTEYPKPTSLWLNHNSDESSIGHITIPAFSKNVKGVPSSFTYRFCFLKNYPEWMFLRVTFDGANTALTFKCDAGWTEFVPPNTQGAGRYVLVNGEHYLINGPKPFPNKQTYDSFVLYAANSAKLDHDMSVLIFEPEQAELINMRSMPNSTRAFLFSVKAIEKVKHRILTFALGNFVVSDGETAAEDFYKSGEDKKIRNVLRSIDWDNIKVDKTIENREVAKAKQLIMELSEAGQPIDDEANNLDSLRIAMEQAEKSKNYDLYFEKLRELEKKNRTLTIDSLDVMLNSL